MQWHSQREEGIGTSHLASIPPVGWLVGAIHVHTGWTFMDRGATYSAARGRVAILEVRGSHVNQAQDSSSVRRA